MAADINVVVASDEELTVDVRASTPRAKRSRRSRVEISCESGTAKARAKSARTAKAPSKIAEPKKRRPLAAATDGDDGAETQPAKRRRVVDEEEVNEQEGAALKFLQSSVVGQDRAAFIARETGLERGKVAGAVRLFDAGNTLPFIARYRKEQTGCLDEKALRHVERSLGRVETLEKRRRSIGVALMRQGKLEEVRVSLLASSTLEELEDLYEPYKTKKRTRAVAAQERGLGSLADLIDNVGGREHWRSPDEIAARFLSQERGVASSDEALAGARDIVAERLCRSPEVKNKARQIFQAGATLTSKRKKDADTAGRFKNYWEFRSPLQSLRPHQFLAVQRGEREKVLSVAFTCAPNAEECVVRSSVPWRGSDLWLKQRWAAMADGVKRLLRPAIEREWRRMLKERAEDEAYETYRRNLNAKLLTPPLHFSGRNSSVTGCVSKGGDSSTNRGVVGLDPGYRTGCKIAVVDATGRVLETATAFPFPLDGGGIKPQHVAAGEALATLLDRYQPAVVAIGNGTASAETEDFVRRVLRSRHSSVLYTIVDESGASVYSASTVAGAELPQLDVALRGAVSIARRVLDPLAELTKIDPQSIGVGLYQHDIDQRRLKGELRGAVEESVNAVGVDVNTASPTLLSHVAGLSAKLAQAVVAHRDANGPFQSRNAIRGVKGLGPRAFEQSAGFLRLHGDARCDPLDGTAVHPESYGTARILQERFGTHCEQWESDETSRANLVSLSEELGCGVETLTDIIDQLRGTAQDPRSKQPPLLLKRVGSGDVGDASQEDGIDAMEAGLCVKELARGMRLRGVIRNVVAFGSFVDIGVHHDALLHVSQYPRPRPNANWPMVNDRVVVTVDAMPEQRGKNWRISVSMSLPSL
eukprot:TRINITY_DN11906_c0_g2_i1.p1 TRINITY_DN11906_c0_g2~~TRINITY_DN11906_c0_g2_i1.p1  ORF type:complete len:893 (-),score=150.19 TRINITY_DN11906_c0_g2_i1:311-2929(-)